MVLVAELTGGVPQQGARPPRTSDPLDAHGGNAAGATPAAHPTPVAAVTATAAAPLVVQGLAGAAAVGGAPVAAGGVAPIPWVMAPRHIAEAPEVAAVEVVVQIGCYRGKIARVVD